MKKIFYISLIVLLSLLSITFCCFSDFSGAVQFKMAQIQGGIIVMGYQRPVDFDHFEIFVSTGASFNPTGWNGSAWTGAPNSPETWNGTTNTLYMITTNEPAHLPLPGGTRYYAKIVVVNKAGSRSAPSGEDSAISGNYQQSATYSIAPYNALARSLASADYKCNGTGDQITIQSAIDAMPEVKLEGGVSQGTFANSIANYDCESAKPTLNSVSSDYRLTSTLSAVQVHSGSQALRLATASGTGNNQNYFMGTNSTTAINGLIPGRKYTFSAWGRLNNAAVTDLTNVSIRFRQYYSGSWHDTLSNHPTSFQTWQQLTLDIILDSTATGALLSILINEDIAGVSHWDDFSLTDWNSITLESGESSANDDFNGLYLDIASGTGAGQRKKITDYDGSTKRVTIGVGDHWTTRPDNTSEYSIVEKCGKIIFMEGTFRVSAAIKIPSGITLEGMGPGTVFRIENGTNSIMNAFENDDLVNGGRDIVIRNITVNGNKKNQSSGSQIGIYFSNVKKSIIDKATFKNFRSVGIYLQASNDNAILGGKFINNTLYGIGLNGNNNIVNKCYFTENLCGVQTDSVIKNQITECQFVKNNGHGIDLSGSDSTIITGCQFDSNGQQTDNVYSGIFVNTDADNNSIQNNVFRKGTLSNQPAYGIRIDDATCDNNLIANNDCYDSGATAGISDVGTGTVIGPNRMNDGAWTTTPN